MGSGTGLPTLVLFHYFLRHPNPGWSAIILFFADYNLSVLETSTIPNLLLTWHFLRTVSALPREGNLEVTENLLIQFLDDLSNRSIHLSGISGAWGDAFFQLVNPKMNPHDREGMETMIMASETIYSPASIHPFTEVLMQILNDAGEVKGRAKALVAAKRIYFGVGGGVDEFLQVLQDHRGKATCVWESAPSGVGKVILEVVNGD